MPSVGQFKSKEEYNAYFRNYRKKNREKTRRYQRDYNRLWRKKNGYHNEYNWQKKNPSKVKVERILRYAIKAGKIKRMPCLICGNRKSVAHHPNYHKPLAVVFLCHAHHRQYHYGLKKPIGDN